jgi:hypothetical protein
MAWQFAPGNILTAADLNAVTKPWNALCQLRQSATQSITNNSVTVVLFDTEDLDPLGWHSTSSNTERVTPTIAGWYRMTVNLSWGNDGDYIRHLCTFLKNGVGLSPNIYAENGTIAIAGTPSFMLPSVLIQLNGSTDYFSLSVYQQNTSAGANTVQCRLLVELVYPT